MKSIFKASKITNIMASTGLMCATLALSISAVSSSYASEPMNTSTKPVPVQPSAAASKSTVSAGSTAMSNNASKSSAPAKNENCNTPPKEGQDWVAADQMPKERVSQKNNQDVAVEFFNYACIHCAHFFPTIKASQSRAEAMKSKLKFVYIPVAFRPDWEVGSRLYFAMQSSGLDNVDYHQRIFNAIHVDKKPLLTNDKELADFLNKMVGEKKSKDVISQMKSFDTENKLKYAKRISAEYQVNSTPMVFVDKLNGSVSKLSPEVSKSLVGLGLSIDKFAVDSCRK